jgi:hypothetical protein
MLEFSGSEGRIRVETLDCAPRGLSKNGSLDHTDVRTRCGENRYSGIMIRLGGPAKAACRLGEEIRVLCRGERGKRK